MGWVHHASPVLDAESRWPLILGVCISLTTLMAQTVGLRLYVRVRMVKSVGVDDYVMLLAGACSVIYNGLCIAQSRYGLGLPLGLRPTANLNTYSAINFAGRPFYMAGILGFKVALCFSYLRFISSVNGGYRAVVWSFMILATLAHVGGTLVLLFQCSPVRKSWRPHTAGSCLPNDTTFYCLAAMSIFCDVCIFLLPIPLLMQVHINPRRKIALVAIFSLGLFTTVCSIMRMVQIITIAKTGDSTMLVLWGTIEMNVGILLTCLPCLTPLFTYFANKSRTSDYGVYIGPGTGEETCNSVQLKPVGGPSQRSGPMGVTTESQEHIVATTKDELVIQKTTEVEISAYEQDVTVVGSRQWGARGWEQSEVNHP